MAIPNIGDEPSSGATIIAPVGKGSFWPVLSHWRAVVEIRDQYRPPEWMLRQVKAVPLSSRIERSLLESVRADDGRAVLERASEPGEHRVAAAVIAALRLAEDHPDRALRFLAWIAQGPDDPADLRFLRRYLPGLRVLVRLDPELGAAIPIGREALGLLAAELFRNAGDFDKADQVLATLTPSAPISVARAGIRLATGDLEGVHAFAQDRPVVDDITVALRVMNAVARERGDDPTAALAEVRAVTEGRQLSGPVERFARAVQAQALRATGRDIEAGLLDEEFGMKTEPDTIVVDLPEGPEPPAPPLFGRSLTDALDDAWARVRRQPAPLPIEALVDRSRIDPVCDEAVTLIRSEHFEAAESMLLAAMDRADAWVDDGGAVVEDFFVLLAGLFAQQGLTTEEVATLERLRAAHQRAGTEVSGEVSERLIEVRASLDALV